MILDMFTCIFVTCFSFNCSLWYSLWDQRMIGWLVVFYVPSTARSFRDGTTIYCPLQRTWSSVFTPFPSGIEPRAVAWQFIALPLRNASSMTNEWRFSLDYNKLYPVILEILQITLEVYQMAIDRPKTVWKWV